jgi:hypothetical protein
MNPKDKQDDSDSSSFISSDNKAIENQDAYQHRSYEKSKEFLSK